MNYIIFTLAFITFLSSASLAKGDDSLILKYDIYAGGFKVLEATLNMDMEETEYDMNLEAETQGFIGKLFPWKAKYNTSGKSKDGKLIPQSYEKSSEWRGQEKTTKMDYDEKGNVKEKTLDWMIDYNENRPHKFLKYRTPMEILGK